RGRSIRGAWGRCDRPTGACQQTHPFGPGGESLMERNPNTPGPNLVERLLYNPVVLIIGGLVALVWWAPQAVDLARVLRYAVGGVVARASFAMRWGVSSS